MNENRILSLSENPPSQTYKNPKRTVASGDLISERETTRTQEVDFEYCDNAGNALNEYYLY